MSALFSYITSDYITIRKRGVFPRINMVDFSKPTVFSNNDFFMLEKFAVERNSEAAMALASQAVSSQHVLYYMNQSVFMSSNIYMGGVDLQVDPQYIDISGFVHRGAPTMIDTETDLSRYTYIYRIFYLNTDVPGTSQYVGCSTLSTLLEEFLLQNAIDNVYGSLYRYRDNGIIVEKGLPMMHTTERFRGPIEKVKGEARNTAIETGISYIEKKLDIVDESVETIYTKMSELESQIIGGIIHRVPMTSMENM